MDVFELRHRVVSDYSGYVRSFLRIKDERITGFVEQRLAEGILWPDPLIQLNPAFEPGGWVDELVDQAVLHEECANVFRAGKVEDKPGGKAMLLHRHQVDAIHAAKTGGNYVLTTGTGSGKSLAYIVPIVDHVLRNGSGRGVQAIVVYPMNALANSQLGELEKFLKAGYPEGATPVTFARYTGQESQEEREAILAKAPDIILTNYVMLELLMTRTREEKLIAQAQGLRYLVLDELHTYRGRQGADVSFLIRRVRERLGAANMQCVGTSATLAGSGTLDEQRREVATVATKLFGALVKPEHVIGETLRRITPETPLNDVDLVKALIERAADPDQQPSSKFDAFITDPLSIWLESTFGVERDATTDRLVRAQPKPITGPEGAAAHLAEVTGASVDQCAAMIRTGLLGGYRCESDPETGFKPFAFRLHQFLSRGDNVYGSLEAPALRYHTMSGQQYVPNDRTKILFPLVFCRECGHEYYSVRRTRTPDGMRDRFVPRKLSDRYDDATGASGFLYLSATNPWPTNDDAIPGRMPDEMTEELNGALRLRKDFGKYKPLGLTLDTEGLADAGGLVAHWIEAPFRYCLNCRVSYPGASRSDFGKLAELGTAGRSTATTVLTLAAVRYLKHETSLPERAKKLLSFTDNRQDASLQAGHFNDFVEIGVLRSALYRAVKESADGLEHDAIAKKVVDAMGLPIGEYAVEPNVKHGALADTKRALEGVVAYRLYRDLKRGWRITMPNLEQTGLLSISYPYLDDVCRDESMWSKRHAALTTATPDERVAVARVLLDNVMRSELAIFVDYLNVDEWERIKQRSSQYLVAPWAIDEDERPEPSAVVFPRSRSKHDDRGNRLWLSGRTAFGQFLRRLDTFPNYRPPARMTVIETQTLIIDLLEVLKEGGLVQLVQEPEGKDDVSGYQLKASAMRWCAGSGVPGHNPLKTPTKGDEEKQTNQFFAGFYMETARLLAGIHAHEHTAQVYHEVREERERDFRTGKLPVLFCSPTMELGVDIAELNVVGLRNAPPTPANYAQRSGRAGRSGQPALVFTYCAAASSHDQYFFKRPERMVAGAVTPPRLELANEDLVRAHVQAIWLAEADLNLGKSLTDVLLVEGDDPTLEIKDSVKEKLAADQPRARARARATTVLASITQDLASTPWYTDGWLDGVLQKIPQRFEQACERWRQLYMAAHEQHKKQSAIVRDASRQQRDKAEADRIAREAKAQLQLLTDEGASDAQSTMQSDFYSYRYFASEGFLPGYNFPRLPLSAYVPGRGRRKGRDEFLSRPRFLAISEFGPRAIVYHEGSRYIIHKAILPVGTDDLVTSRVKKCEACSYLHPIHEGEGPDVCEKCGSLLGQGAVISQLFRLQNVATRRKDRIVSDEEERMRLGYEIVTGLRFTEHEGRTQVQVATVEDAAGPIATLTYGHAATLWRINMGWRRRKPNESGFVLDVERGYWARNQVVEDDDDRDPLSPKTIKVIPYVEDHRNCLVIRPATELSTAVMASLQAALKSAIQVVYQLEDQELAAEPLPSVDDRREILLYESAEGGAGVLRQLVQSPGAMADVARRALEICHFDEDGTDRRRAPRAREDCEAACYDCLMSYSNQGDHDQLDRQALKPVLLELANAVVAASPTEMTRADHLAALLEKCESELERRWVKWLDAKGYRLPSQAQRTIAQCKTRPDFFYAECNAVVYIDGPPHDHPDRQQRDAAQAAAMEDLGFEVIRFRHDDQWDEVRSKHPHVFGNGK